jgi:hypothetical protein
LVSKVILIDPWKGEIQRNHKYFLLRSFGFQSIYIHHLNLTRSPPRAFLISLSLFIGTKEANKGEKKILRSAFRDHNTHPSDKFIFSIFHIMRNLLFIQISCNERETIRSSQKQQQQQFSCDREKYCTILISHTLFIPTATTTTGKHINL